MSVAEDQGGPDAGRDQATGASHVEGTTPLVETDPDQVAVAGEPPYGRGSQLQPVLGLSDARSARVTVEGGVVDGDHHPGAGAVTGRRQVGGQGVPGNGDQGVPHPGTVVARLGLRLTGRVGRRVWLGHRQQHRPQHRTVLDGAPAVEPDTTATVVADREVAAEVGGPIFPVELPLDLSFVTLRVDHTGEVAPGALEVGGVEPGCLGDQHLLTAAAGVLDHGQPVDRGQDHVRLFR